MGTIALAPGTVAYVDANALIYAVEGIEPYATLLRPVWEAARVGAARLIGSELLIIEALKRNNSATLEEVKRELANDSFQAEA